MRECLSTLLVRLAGRRGRIPVVLTIVFAGVVLSAAPAAADPAPIAGTTCNTAPDVQSPGAGVTAQLMPARNGLPTGAQASMFEQYGLAGLNFDTYDVGIDTPTGCLPNNKSIDGAISDDIANMLMTAATGLAAFADSIMRSAYDTSWLAVFDPYVMDVVHRLQTNVFADWAVIAIMAIGVLIILRSRKAEMSSAMGLVGGGIVVFIAATALFAFPVVIGHAFDSTVTGLTQKAADAINNGSRVGDPNAVQRTPDQSLMNSMYDNLFYRAWLSGNFGDPDSTTAKTYGKQLFAAHALTWDENASINAAAAKANPATDVCTKPGFGGGPVGAPTPPSGLVPCSALPLYQKQADFQKIADEIKKADPGAYSYLQGNHGQDRIGYAFLTLIAVLLSLPVIVIGSLAMAICFLVFRFVLVLSPIVAPVGMVQTNVAMSLFDRVASIAVTAFIWGVGNPIVEILNGAVYAAQINPVLRLLLLAVIFVTSLVTLFAYAPGFGGLIKKRHAKRGWGLIQSGLAWLAAGKIAKAVSGVTAEQPEPSPGSPYGTIPTGVTVSSAPDPADIEPVRTAIGGRISANYALPEPPVSGEVVDRGELADTPAPPLPEPPVPDGPTWPSKRVLDDDQEVYVITTDEDLNWRDPTDFEGGDEVYGEPADTTSVDEPPAITTGGEE